MSQYRIVLSDCQQELLLQVVSENVIVQQDKLMLNDEKMTEAYIFYWCLNALKPIFRRMAIEKEQFGVELSFDVSPQFVERYQKSVLQNLSNVMHNTYQYIKKYCDYENNGRNYEKILFFDADNNDRFFEVYHRCLMYNPSITLYQSMYTGFNKVTREWEKPDYLLPDELISLIMTECIKKIVSFNMYYLESILTSTGVYLLAVLDFIGVEYVIIDFDIYDSLGTLGYIKKACFSYENTRFSIFPHMQKYWDDHYKIAPLNYIANPQENGSGEINASLTEDYRVLVMSHSRIEQTASNLLPILYVFNQFADINLFDQLQKWYYAMRYLVLHKFPLSMYEREYYHDHLYVLYLSGISMIKYHVISSIKTDRYVEIYGDEGWKKIFPQYYQNRYLSAEEKIELCSQGKYLHLLLNANYTYLESNGVIMDAIAKNIPFITLPAMVKTPEFLGFEHIEYYDKQSLNELIEQAPYKHANEMTLKKSIQAYRQAVNENRVCLERSIMLDEPFEQNNRFHRLVRRHNILAEKLILQYVIDHYDQLLDHFEVLCLGKPTTFRIENSKFSEYDYVKTLYVFSQK